MSDKKSLESSLATAAPFISLINRNKSMKRLTRPLATITVLSLFVFVSLGTTGCCHDQDDTERGWTPGAILLAGGQGGNGFSGGAGGLVVITSNNGDSSIATSGLVNTSFMTPDQPAYNLGTNPWIVTANRQIVVYVDTTDADNNALVGEYLLILNNPNILLKRGAADYLPVTGNNPNRGCVNI